MVTVLTIDGPTSSGKGTISRTVAARLHWHLLDSGALYRLVALRGQQLGLEPDNIEGHAAAAEALDADFGAVQDEEQIWLAGQDVTQEVRTAAAGMGASRVAAWPAVREALLDRQRRFAREPGLVADGRDMGTVVFPYAALKVFLTASPEERARRRYKQLKDKGSGVSLAALSREIAERDLKDSTRAVAPLRPAPDAHVIDSTDLNIQDVVEQVLALGRSCSLWH
ncbi:MAG TPA: (d)CMP kinase [Steroidobacteraceae bacterium]|jgi:cytidylate kinase|nr:(d)CMP kinase [Steroidobacteraceae bacterium]